MARFTLLFAALFALVGCAEKPEPMAEPPVGEQSAPPTNAQSPQGGSGEIGIVSPAAGAMAPVTNSDSVAGSGAGGVGQAAKDQARRIGGGQSQGSLGTDVEDGG